MHKIAITHPLFFDGEAQAIESLLAVEGFWRVHVRKPGSTVSEVEQLLQAISPKYYPQISIHDHLGLAQKYGLGGVHLNSRCGTAPAGWKGLVSRSLHSLAETGSYDYAFLSPVYDSISKRGYKRAFEMSELAARVDSRIFALGGVEPGKLPELEDAGFGGAAMLGCLWRAKVDAIKFRLQFITHPKADLTLAQEAEQALKGGCRWVQLRHKDATRHELIAEGRAISELCRRYGATFIIDDHVDLVRELQADGVHLGKNDMPVDEARKMLGPMKIIGATANELADIERAAAADADYIGLGPFRFTTTKAKLSPTLGLAGYERIISKSKLSSPGLPIVAIGGIKAEDVEPIMAAGADGVAVSGAIIGAPDPEKETRLIIDQIEKSTIKNIQS